MKFINQLCLLGFCLAPFSISAKPFENAPAVLQAVLDIAQGWPKDATRLGDQLPGGDARWQSYAHELTESTITPTTLPEDPWRQLIVIAERDSILDGDRYIACYRLGRPSLDFIRALNGKAFSTGLVPGTITEDTKQLLDAYTQSEVNQADSDPSKTAIAAQFCMITLEFDALGDVTAALDRSFEYVIHVVGPPEQFVATGWRMTNGPTLIPQVIGMNYPPSTGRPSYMEVFVTSWLVSEEN